MTQPMRTHADRFCCVQRLVSALLLFGLAGCTALPASPDQLRGSVERFLENPWQDPFRQPNLKPHPLASTAQLKLNNCGGVGEQAVQLFSEDDQSNATAGKAAITRLAANRVGVVIGAIGSEVSNATVDIAVKNQIVQISPASANAVLTQRALKGEFQGFWFRTMPPDMLQGEALARLAQQKNFKTVAILAVDNDYGNSIVQAFTATAKQLGNPAPSQIVRYSPNASLYDINVLSPFAAQPDAVLVIAPPALGGDMLRLAFESGTWSGTTKVLASASLKTDRLAIQAGRSPDGRYNASNVWGVTFSSSSTMLQFRELYKQKFDREPGPYDPNTWDAAAVAVLAAEAARAANGSAIRSKIAEVASNPGIEIGDICQALSLVREGKDINYQGTSGTLDFNRAGDAVGNYDVWTVDYMGAFKVESKLQVGSLDQNLDQTPNPPAAIKP
jgi:ABC-type branched-subunit amino acid transport system substrate-binding protein